MHVTVGALFLETHTVNAVKAPVLLCPKGHEGTELHNIWDTLAHFAAQLRPAVLSWCDEICLKAAMKSIL